MDHITDIFTHYIEQYDSFDIAESEFMKAIHEDPELRADYRAWCHDMGSTERSGFSDWAEEYLESKNEVWNNLSSDFDE